MLPEKSYQKTAPTHSTTSSELCDKCSFACHQICIAVPVLSECQYSYSSGQRIFANCTQTHTATALNIGPHQPLNRSLQPRNKRVLHVETQRQRSNILSCYGITCSTCKSMNWRNYHACTVHVLQYEVTCARQLFSDRTNNANICGIALNSIVTI